METVLYKTIHGSHLYGLSHADSDEDWYTVVSRHKRGARKRYAKQSITDGVDTMKVDLSTFVHFCQEGVPQALEALFAPAPEVDLLTAYRWSYSVDTARATRTYRRTIANFAEEGSFKRKRHAVRLWLNMLEFQEKGYFNPRLTENQKLFCTDMASLAEDHWAEFIDEILGGEQYGYTDYHARYPGLR